MASEGKSPDQRIKVTLVKSSNGSLASWHCKICPETFVTRKLLRDHCKSAHPRIKLREVDHVEQSEHKPPKEAPILPLGEWKCKDCSETFFTRQKLRDHRSQVHILIPRGPPKKKSKIMQNNDAKEIDSELVACKTESQIEENSHHIQELVVCSPQKNSNFLILSEPSPDNGELLVIEEVFEATLNPEEFEKENENGDHHNFTAANDSNDRETSDETHIEDTEMAVLKKEPTENALGKSGVWRCQICDATFTTRKAKRDHRRIKHRDIPRGRKTPAVSTEKAPYSCSVCHHGFSYPSWLLKHQHRTGHNMNWTPKTFQCPLCSMTFRSENLLLKHSKEDCTQRLLTCPHCGLQRLHPSRMQRHTKGCRGEVRHCTRCHLFIPNTLALQVHMKDLPCVAKASGQLQCVLCGLEMPTLAALMQHRWLQPHRNLTLLRDGEEEEEGEQDTESEQENQQQPEEKQTVDVAQCDKCHQKMYWGIRSHHPACPELLHYKRVFFPDTSNVSSAECGDTDEDAIPETPSTSSTEPRVQCQRCGRRFPCPSLMVSHAFQCRGVVRHCAKCHYTFASQRALLDHETKSACRRMGPNEFPCSRCGKYIAPDLVTLWRHRGAIPVLQDSEVPVCSLRGTEESHICPVCGKKVTIHGLAQHTRHCEGVGEFCVVCRIPWTEMVDQGTDPKARANHVRNCRKRSRTTTIEDNEVNTIECSRTAGFDGHFEVSTNGLVGCGFCKVWCPSRWALLEHLSKAHVEPLTETENRRWRKSHSGQAQVRKRKKASIWTDISEDLPDREDAEENWSEEDAMLADCVEEEHYPHHVVKTEIE